ncbi:MAG: hypothetical protein KDA85_11025, partial [Planctomycetaceae bacterium]|nr:hypothetical protein [Planctomycetaceae bacterium]
MGEIFPFLLFGGFLLFGVLALFISLQLEKKRSSALRTASEELGFTFSPTGDPMLRERFSRFELMQRGRSHRLTNLLQRSADHRLVQIFDFFYRTGSGKNSSTHSQTVFAITDSSLALPTMSFQPEGFLLRLAAKLGYQDINFDHAPT